MEDAMRTRFAGSATTVFLLFFGLALLDAIRSRNIAITAYWLFVGMIFVYADIASARKRTHV
jgi:hypothetical protein